MCDDTDFNKFYFPEPLILLKKVSQKRRVKKRVKRRVLLAENQKNAKKAFYEFNDFFCLFWAKGRVKARCHTTTRDL